MPLSPAEIEELLNELRRQMVGAGFGELDSAIIRMQGEAEGQAEFDDTKGGPGARPAIGRLQDYVERLEECLGGTGEVSAYASTMSALGEVVRAERSFQVGLALPAAIGADIVGFQDLASPRGLLGALRRLLNEILEDR